jgi:hypothetical protein
MEVERLHIQAGKTAEEIIASIDRRKLEYILKNTRQNRQESNS